MKTNAGCDLSIDSQHVSPIKFNLQLEERKKCHECIHYQVFLNEAQVRKSGSHIVHIPIDTYDFACQFNMQIMFTFVYCKLSKAPSYALIAHKHAES